MITSTLFGEDYVPLLVWSVGCWVAGVSWAAYRAVGWVERIQVWARTCEVETEQAVTGFVPAGTDATT